MGDTNNDEHWKQVSRGIKAEKDRDAMLHLGVWGSLFLAVVLGLIVASRFGLLWGAVVFVLCFVPGFVWSGVRYWRD